MNKEEMDKLLEELRKEYKVELKPLTPPRFTVRDILEKYYQQIWNKVDKISQGTYDMSRETAFTAITRTVCLKHGYWTLKQIPEDERKQFRQDLEDFIKYSILTEEYKYENMED
jgi:hypothetical protein